MFVVMWLLILVDRMSSSLMVLMMTMKLLVGFMVVLFYISLFPIQVCRYQG